MQLILHKWTGSRTPTALDIGRAIHCSLLHVRACLDVQVSLFNNSRGQTACTSAVSSILPSLDFDGQPALMMFGTVLIKYRQRSAIVGAVEW